MSWTIPFWYSTEEEKKKESIGQWISDLFTPTVQSSIIPLLVIIGGVLIVAFILFRKMRVI